MFCHQCGAGIDDPGDRYCSRCGAPLHRADGAVPPGPASPLGEPPADRHRRPISTWPDQRRERVQLPLTELRQRRARGPAEPVPVPPPVPVSAPEPPAPEPAEPTTPTGVAAPPGVETVETGEPLEEEESTSRSRAEAALRRMVPPKDEWAAENRPGPAERATVRDEWPGTRADEPAPPVPAVVAPASRAPAPPVVDEEIIPWLEPPVTPVPPERPAPPSREAKPEEGPIIVPRDYDENVSRQRKGRRRGPRARGALFDPAALGRSIKPSWILAIAGVILLTLIVFAIFPPGGAQDAATGGKVNPFTRMPVHTVATPVRPTGGAGTAAETIPTVASATPGTTNAQRAPIFGALPSAPTRAETVTATTTTVADAGGTGIRVVVSTVGGWSGTIGQQAETYTETPVVGSGTQVRSVTGPATMITANIQKLDQTTDPLEVRVEKDGVLLKSGSTSEPAGIVALSVQV